MHVETHRIHFVPEKLHASGDTVWSALAYGQKRQKHVSARIKYRRIAHAYGRNLPALYCDLLDIALAVYASDLVCPRHAAGVEDPYGMQWSRG